MAVVHRFDCTQKTICFCLSLCEIIDAHREVRGDKSGPSLQKLLQNLLIKMQSNHKKVYAPQKFSHPLYTLQPENWQKPNGPSPYISGAQPFSLSGKYKGHKCCRVIFRESRTLLLCQDHFEKKKILKKLS